MARLKRSISFLLLFSTCVAILALAFANKKQSCIESKDIQVISWHQASEPIKVFSCNYSQDEKSIQKMDFAKWKQTEFIESVAQSLEGLFFTLSKANISNYSKRSPYQVFIFNNQDNIARAVKNGIYISHDMLNKKNLTELFIKSWLQQKLPQLKAQFDLRFQLLVDFILYANGENYDFSQDLKWIHGLQSVKSYCQSSWKLLDHSQTCENNKSQELSFLGLRPLLLKKLIASYQEISLSEQYYFLKNLLNKINQYTSSEFSDSKQSLSLMDKYFDKYKDEERFLSFLIPNYRSESKFEPLLSSLIYMDSMFFKEEIYKKLDIKTDAIFIEKQTNNIYLSIKSNAKDSLLPLQDKKILDYLSQNKLIYITSTAAKSSELLEHKPQFDKALNIVIKDIKEFGELKLDSYLQKNIYEFMLVNKNISFYLYHLESLALGEKYNYNDQLTSFSLDKTYNSYFSNGVLDKIKWKRTVN